jgi:hypothetical protein
MSIERKDTKRPNVDFDAIVMTTNEFWGHPVVYGWVVARRKRKEEREKRRERERVGLSFERVYAYISSGRSEWMK